MFVSGNDYGPCDMTRPSTIEDIAFEIGRYNYRFTSEAELQIGLSTALHRAGCVFTRESHLTNKDRIDFFIHGSGIGIEVKIGGSTSDLIAQVFRYTESELIQGVVVVTSRARHKQLPADINGKPIRVVHLLNSCL